MRMVGIKVSILSKVNIGNKEKFYKKSTQKHVIFNTKAIVMHKRNFLCLWYETQDVVLFKLTLLLCKNENFPK